MNKSRTVVAVLVALSAAVVTASLQSSCAAPRGRLVAKRIDARQELIGGPRALGELGDFLLENDRVRLIIQDAGFSRGFGVFGGSLIDADLVRTSTGAGNSQGGTGKDNFGEMFPAMFVEAVEPSEVQDPNAEGNVRLPALEVERDGSDGDEAVLVVRGYGNDFLAMTQVANEVLLDDDRDEPAILFTTRYRLKPGVPYVEIETTVQNVSFPPRELRWDGGTRLLGAPLPTPVGDIALFGAGNKVFVPHDAGYDLRYRLEREYKKGYELPAVPGLVVDYVAVSGPDVSYGIVAAPSAEPQHNYALSTGQFDGAEAHSLHVPFVASAFTGMFYVQPPVLAPNDKAPGGDDELTFKRYFIVGHGDVASVSDVVFELLGKETGLVEGRVLEEQTNLAVRDASVILIDDAGRKVTQAETGSDGRFRARVPAGRYRAIARVEGRSLSQAVAFSARAGERSFPDLRVAPAATVVVTVTEPGAGRVPAKVILVGNYPAEHAGEDTRGFLFDLSLGEHWRYSDLVPDDAGAPDTRRYIEASGYAHDGTVTLEARPGSYRVFVQRGPEYTRFEGEVTLVAGAQRSLTASLERVVDTEGYVSADFHLHSIYSLDSFADLESRMAAYAGEDLEYAVSTDHNFVTDYKPTILRLGLERYLNSAVGLELSTIDRGHYNGFPLRFDEGVPVRQSDGSYEGTIASRTFGSFNWAGEDPQVIFDGMRKLGREKKVDPACTGDDCEMTLDDVIVQVNHPRGGIGGYFDVYGLRHETLRAEGQSGLFAAQVDQHPEFGGDRFSWSFDAIEILNGTRNEWLHHFRVPDNVSVDPVSCCPLTAGEVFQKYVGFECDDTLRDCACTPDDTATQIEAGACDGLGVAYPGVMDDWFQMLKAGLRVTGTANSDSHSDDSGVPGWPRTYVSVPDDNPRNVREQDIVRGLRSGDVTMSIGGFLLAKVAGVGLGGVVSAAGQSEVMLEVELRVAPWIEFDRIVVYRSGERVAVKEIERSGDVYATEIAVPISGDGFLVVEAEGDQNLFPSLYPNEIPPLLLDEAITAVGGSIGLGRSPDALYPELIAPVRPRAVTNPIFVDADGDGEVTPTFSLPEARMTSSSAPRQLAGHEREGEPLRSVYDGAQDERAPLPSLEHVSPLMRAQLERMPRWLWPTNDPRDIRRLFWHAWRDAHTH